MSATHWFVALLGTCIFLAVFLLAILTLTRTPRATLQRIREVTQHGAEYRHRRSLRGDWGQRCFAIVYWLRARLGLGDNATLPQRLLNAGYRSGVATDAYNTTRIFLPAILLAVGCAVPWFRAFWIIALPAIGYITPNIVLTRLIHSRREKIRRSIPDAIDLLVICVDAGLGIDQALLRVGQELAISHPEFTEELLQINREQRAGKPRIQAWSDMAKRSDLADLHAFAGMLLQTERFGTPIARALSGFADSIRLQRRQLAEQMAAKTTVKIVFPLVFFIFPSLFIVLLAPAVIGIMRGLAAMGM